MIEELKKQLNNVKLSPVELKQVEQIQQEANQKLKNNSNRQDVGQSEADKIQEQANAAINKIKKSAFARENEVGSLQLEKEEALSKVSRREQDKYDQLEATYDQKIAQAKDQKAYNLASPAEKQKMDISRKHDVLKSAAAAAQSKAQGASRHDFAQVEQLRLLADKAQNDLYKFEKNNGLLEVKAPAKSYVPILNSVNTAFNQLFTNIKENQSVEKSMVNFDKNMSTLDAKLDEYLNGSKLNEKVKAIENFNNVYGGFIKQVDSAIKGLSANLNETSKQNELDTLTQKQQVNEGKIKQLATKLAPKSNIFARIIQSISNSFSGVSQAKLTSLQADNKAIASKIATVKHEMGSLQTKGQSNQMIKANLEKLNVTLNASKVGLAEKLNKKSLNQTVNRSEQLANTKNSASQNKASQEKQVSFNRG